MTSTLFKYSKSILFLFVTILLGACSPYEDLLRKANTAKHVAEKLESNKSDYEKTPDDIYISPIIINDKSYTNAPIVRKAGFQFLPLLVVYASKFNVYCQQGNKMFSEPIQATMYQNIAGFFQNATSFNVSNDSNSRYKLQVTIDSIHASVSYMHKSSLIMNILYLHKNYIENEKAWCKMHYQLFKDNQLISTKTFSVKTKLFSNTTRKSTYYNFPDQVINALSYTVNYNVKSLSIEVINDIINHFNSQQSNGED